MTAYHGEEVREKCLKAWETGNFTISEIANRYGASRATIRRWINGGDIRPIKRNRDKEWAALEGALGKQGAAVGEIVAPNHSDSIVMAIPDLHCPFEHPDALAFLKAVKAKYQPTTFVCLGDEVDFYGMSRFTHDPDVMNPGAELSDAVRHLIPFYNEFPNMLVCQSNHTHRVHKKAVESGLPKGTIKSIEEILKTPEGWIYKQCHRVDNVDYKHGTGKSGANAHVNHAKATGRSTCIGHIHAWAAVNYLRKNLFAANFSCLINKYAPCFAYAADMDDNIVLGCGIVINGIEAHFIPMHVDDDNNWTGKL